ncbi:hypothetical protein AGABI1DRAFT_100017 [Agaricus bisporus var. burnettii JB137-S8]|uniref:Bola-like protein n=1 Tax=Agaricus bisporus var. burnettii (strain JB137-S8 / ATCC MYA-4627 / FGSC 10392) TaxID=597362 RepID=K5XAX4_AGABU|nr:uncharacterized protein AGABI1DRAFT_100017 [Agaricus bisporus var. burnettii JB137-S8]EKM80413.1 hypothetical protein AGABI1DRAFT_100017 [Agaricus bisporus var. burnettii JB137-S8]
MLARLRPRSLRFYSTPSPPSGLSINERGLYQKLAKRFSPTALKVQDVSGGCGDFYAIEIASDEFKGLSKIKQHKLVNSALAEEIKSMHGLQLQTMLPGGK